MAKITIETMTNIIRRPVNDYFLLLRQKKLLNLSIFLNLKIERKMVMKMKFNSEVYFHIQDHSDLSLTKSRKSLKISSDSHLTLTRPLRRKLRIGADTSLIRQKR